MTKKRVGHNPLESVIKDTTKAGRQRGRKPESPEVRKPELPEILKGKKNFYINKEGEIIQKVTIHLPLDLVDKLKREALDKRITLSEIIRERL